jgi:hypothetical protein
LILSQATNSSGKQGLRSEDFRESFSSSFYPKLKFPRVVIAIYFNTFEADQKLVVPQQGEVWWNNKGNRGVDKQMMW